MFDLQFEIWDKDEAMRSISEERLDLSLSLLVSFHRYLFFYLAPKKGPSCLSRVRPSSWVVRLFRLAKIRQGTRRLLLTTCDIPAGFAQGRSRHRLATQNRRDNPSVSDLPSIPSIRNLKILFLVLISRSSLWMYHHVC